MGAFDFARNLFGGAERIGKDTLQNLSHPAGIPKNLYNNTVGQVLGKVDNSHYHPRPTINTATDPMYAGLQPVHRVPLPPQFAQHMQQIIPGQPMPSVLPQMHPLLQFINAVYGGLQPYGDVPEDDISPQQALQPVDFNNGQATLNGQLFQGPPQGNYLPNRLQVRNNAYRNLR